MTQPPPGITGRSFPSPITRLAHKKPALLKARIGYRAGIGRSQSTSKVPKAWHHSPHSPSPLSRGAEMRMSSKDFLKEYEALDQALAGRELGPASVIQKRQIVGPGTVNTVNCQTVNCRLTWHP